MTLVNYHNHTPLCGHACGAPEDYIKVAIASGISEIGFSDHAPIPEPIRENITMSPEQTEDYIKEILSLKSKYKGIIKVRVGFEVDYPLFETFDRSYLSDSRIDYIIGSCHFLDDWAFDNPEYKSEFNRRDIDLVYKDYYECMAMLASSGIFDIVGHFDLVKKFGHRSKKSFESQIEQIARIMSQNGIAAELNTAGLLKPVNEIYPSEDILRIFYRMNVPVTLGADAHSPENAAYYLKEAAELLKKIGYRKISGFESRKRYELDL